MILASEHINEPIAVQKAFRGVALVGQTETEMAKIRGNQAARQRRSIKQCGKWDLVKGGWAVVSKRPL